jgi:hypothetical protein
MTAFEQLLASLAANEPRGGYRRLSQLPPLSDADLAACLTENPSLLCDAIREEHAPRIAAWLVTNSMTIAPTVINLLQDTVRPWLLTEIRCHCDTLNADGVEQHGCVSEADASAPR